MIALSICFRQNISRPAPMAFFFGLLATADETECQNEEADHKADLAQFFGRGRPHYSPAMICFIAHFQGILNRN